ncbi:MAG TPA: hypothetical protein VF453_00500 [Burkholderiaceae bacterium]
MPAAFLEQGVQVRAIGGDHVIGYPLLRAHVRRTSRRRCSA